VTTIVRAPRAARDFTIVGNAVLRDQRLSFKARGLLCLLLSLPDDWKINTAWLAAMAPDGRDAIQSGLRELEATGYVRRHRRQDHSGRWSTITYVYETPSVDNPVDRAVDNVGISQPPEPGFPASENPSVYEELRTKDVPGFMPKRVQVVNPQATCPSCGGAGWIVDPVDAITLCPTCRPLTQQAGA
jgi:hypothetical protein